MRLVALLLLVPTGARASCDLDIAAFGAAKVAVRNALQEDDRATAARIVDDVERRYACLTFAPPRPAWAEWQLLVAVTREAQGDRATAVRRVRYALTVDPFLDRSWLGPRHHLRSLSGPEATAVSPPTAEAHLTRRLDDRVILYVDGRGTSGHVPDDTGPHLVQIQDGTWWDSRFILGSPEEVERASRRDEGPTTFATRGLWVPRASPASIDAWLDMGLRVAGHNGVQQEGRRAFEGLFHPYDSSTIVEPSLVFAGELTWRQALSMWGEFSLTQGEGSSDEWRPSVLMLQGIVHARPQDGQHVAAGLGLFHDRVPGGFYPGSTSVWNSRKLRYSTLNLVVTARFVRGRERRMDLYGGWSPLAGVLGVGIRPSRGNPRYRVGLRAGHRYREAFAFPVDEGRSSTYSQRAYTVGLDLTFSLVDARLNDDTRSPRSRTGRNSRLIPR